MRGLACTFLPLALLAVAAPAQPLPTSPGPTPVFTPSFYVPSNLPTPHLTTPDPPAGEWPIPEPGTTPAPPRPTASLGARVFPPSERALREEQDLGWQANTLLAPRITGRQEDGAPLAPEQMAAEPPMAASLLRQARAQGFLLQPTSPRPLSPPVPASAQESEDPPAPVPFFEVAAAVSPPETRPGAAAPRASAPAAPTASTAALPALPKPVPMASTAGHLTAMAWLLLALVAVAAAASLTALWRRTA